MSITVRNGVDRLGDAEHLLRGRRLGLLSAASGVNKAGIPTYALLQEKYRLCALFAPEHGIRSNLQDGKWGDDGADPETGLPLCSLGRKDTERLDALLDTIDLLVYDIQDVGARFYTYLYNLTDLMQRCAARGLPVLVLDRVDPIGGLLTEGPRLDETRFASGIGRYDLPTRYGLTVGEFARWVNASKGIGAELHVLEVQGWPRGAYADETDLLWVNPSPNIPSVGSAINYIGTCLFEATNLSEGRGTTRPFDLVGAPFIDSAALCDELRARRLPGVTVRRAAFTPQFNKHAGEVCEGIELHITDRTAYRPLYTSLCILAHVCRYPEFERRDAGLCLRYGSDALCGNFDPDALAARDEAALAAFAREVEPFKLYA
ncbi:MAG: DUF1343 domain-containing protein [Clostridia bacterium]|nr:DUF1343 domain-containing protein [Clostridia bacterium]